LNFADVNSTKYLILGSYHFDKIKFPLHFPSRGALPHGWNFVAIYYKYNYANIIIVSNKMIGARIKVKVKSGEVL